MPVVTDSAPVTHRCTRCGADFPVDSLQCPSCGRVAGTQSTKIVLAVTLLLILIGLILTQYFVALHKATEASLANRWFVRGGEAMQAHLPDAAAQDYRTALSYDPENPEYRLRLAQALVAANRLNEARAHLTSLWEQAPSNGEVNLTFARLYARRGDLKNAARYYSNAINGIWQDDPHKRRVDIRFELSEYLMKQHKTTQAQSELMALLADGPREPADQLRLGEMLLQVNEPEHTVEIDNAILTNNPSNADAWQQKGQALLALDKYVDAEQAFSEAVEHNPNLGDAQRQLDLLREVLRIDPSRRGLSRTDRAKRAAEAFHTAWNRLNSCVKQQGVTLAPPTSPTSAQPSPTAAAVVDDTSVTPPSPLQLLYSGGLQKQSTVTDTALREDSDAIDSAMQYAFDVERATASVCPQMGLSDQALLFLAQHENEGVK
jgi:tetratricopeptide (TPR) repeat protein